MNLTRLYELLDSAQAADVVASQTANYRRFADRTFALEKLQRGTAFSEGVTTDDSMMNQLYYVNGTPIADAVAAGDAFSISIQRAVAGFTRTLTDGSVTGDSYNSTVVPAPPTLYTKVLTDGVTIDDSGMTHNP